MNRFFGMMPRKFVEKTKTYVDDLGLKITIEAGPYGWTIMWADNSSTWEDNNATTEENFQKAYNKLTEHLQVTEYRGSK